MPTKPDIAEAEWVSFELAKLLRQNRDRPLTLDEKGVKLLKRAVDALDDLAEHAKRPPPRRQEDD